jgi:small-conductance mechanosensitive channel
MSYTRNMGTIRIITTTLFLLSCLILSAQDTTVQVTGGNLAKEWEGSPVVLSGDTLFHIKSSFGAFSPEDRAKALSARLKEIIQEPQFYPDSLKAMTVEHDNYIMYRSRVLMVINKNDSIGYGMSMEAISGQLISTLKESLTTNSKSFSLWSTIKNIGYTLLVVLVLGLIIRLISWLFKKIYHYAETNKKRLFRSIKINEYEFLTAEREYEVAIYSLKIIKIGLTIFLFIIALPVIFSIFPATEGITRKIIGMVWSPVRNILLSIVNYLPELITIIIIYLIFKYLIRFIRFLSKEVENKVLILPGFYPEWAKPTYNIIRVFLYAFMFVLIFPYLPGSESPAFRGVSVFLGVLLSLGSSSLISNAMAGLVITFMRPYKIGDRIKIDDVEGDVVEKSLMITRIKTIKNEDVTIPNAKILTGYSVNYSTPTEKKGLIIHTTVTIGYDAPWRAVHELLIRAAELTEGVSRSPKPFVLQINLDDFYISYQINAYIRDAHSILKIKSDLHQNIQDEFNRAGVEIMSPHYRSERDGNPVAIPQEWEIELPPKNEKPDKISKISRKQKDITESTE